MLNEMNRRNIGIFAHVDAGKTTTTEHMLFHSGVVRSPGRVDDGTTATDSLDIEKERGISVQAAMTSLIWKDTIIDLIDTPGHIDFISEVERSLRVMDGAILIVSAVEGVQSQSETIWHALRSLGIPTLIYINKMDRVGASAETVIEQIRSSLSPLVCEVQTCRMNEEVFIGIDSLWSAGQTLLTDSPSPVPGLFELLAEFNEELLESYINGESLPAHLLEETFRKHVHQGEMFPICYGASGKGIGVTELLDAIIEFLPAPAQTQDASVSGVVFKIERDKTMGRTAYVRMYGGSVHNRDTIYNSTRKLEEKVTQIRRMDGRKWADTGAVYAGQIAALYGLSDTHVGDIIGSPEGVPPIPQMAVPLLTVQVHGKDTTRYPDLVAALQELTDEDPLLDLQWLPEERELHLKVMGTIQLEILSSLLMSRFGLDVEFDPPSVIYKETPRSSGEGFIAYTMPKPCWAILRFSIEPLPRGSGLIYSSTVRTDHLLLRYQNEVERRIPEALSQGLLGWEVTDLRITLIEGEHHVWHTHPLDFVVATPMGIMDGLASTGTTLLEPILNFRLTVPEEYGGKALSDLVHMRATFEAPIIGGGRCIVEGRMPLATSMDYPVKLRSETSGRGVLTTSFAGYQDCPSDVTLTRKRIGVNPLDQSKYILSVRNAITS
ncbi:TetM/TetW/TetO/TetS family tetracycline resistance ribosomal protection protein [Paenibacillus sp. JNUCC31]|uniref:elongation factor G n=1 Tax=Paenibacillus sp. JNUCC-31 TaxID=2777983 RepID=UPI00177D6771|nr:TetM/TetW/TetO/TetS family tetracycline resistance ribosomal protection protein [Paenibacillus sp. JNUCC-31]QOS78275.1 TetM/TetW/TetO/TetS family tetracycline resistance ribosomal protection protein [Paenibacillus sp. JNUCC-31]